MVCFYLKFDEFKVPGRARVHTHYLIVPLAATSPRINSLPTHTPNGNRFETLESPLYAHFVRTYSKTPSWVDRGRANAENDTKE